MRYRALACDYDGTLAHEGRVDAATCAALARLRASGRELILVSGRRLDDLMQVFSETHLFQRVVAENGALIYTPATGEDRLLGPPPPAQLLEALYQRDVTPLATGRVIIGTWEPQETAVLDAIRELGLEYEIIFNKGAVMVLPSGINKTTGLAAALDELGLSPHNTVAVGDAENDHALLRLCEVGVAVANALPMLRESADLVTAADHGAGVVELIDRILATDLRELDVNLHRHDIPLGLDRDGHPVHLAPQSSSALLCTAGGATASSLFDVCVQALIGCGYQCCVIDPAGRLERLDNAIALVDVQRTPEMEEALAVLHSPRQNLLLSLGSLAARERPPYCEHLLAALSEMRQRLGRPHWTVLWEADAMLTAARAATLTDEHGARAGMLLITAHPERLPHRLVAAVDLVLASPECPRPALDAISEARGQPAAADGFSALATGGALAWRHEPAAAPLWFQPGHAAVRREQPTAVSSQPS
jgi:hydroxymethylpyrimidine pyrophosphatase-like HAD family hydrolase